MNPKTSITIDFAPRFAARWGRGTPSAKPIERMILAAEASQTEWLQRIHALAGFFERIDVSTTPSTEPTWNQNWFPPLDGMSLYTLIAHLRPKRYVEIGSGNSTKFAHRAILDHNLDTRITSIDPYPRAEIDMISNVVVRNRLEDIDLSLFDDLGKDDVILFDGSHRSFMNTDVTVFFIEVLPRLAPEVVVGIHDIFWPDDYPPDWLDRYYNEQYLLGAYMLGAGDRFDLMFACNWMARKRAEQVALGFPLALTTKLQTIKRSYTGGCFWFRSIAPFVS